jgi:hypothetical protein
MTDDVLIHGATDEEEEYQRALIATLKKLEYSGLTLNLRKM